MISALALWVALSADVEPLTMAHAHNDYLHERPLLDALDQGFCSVEADIFLVEGELRVGHTLEETKPGRTLQALYLDPLIARVEANGGSVYKTKASFTLLVDIKADGQKVVDELAKVLPKYSKMLSQTATKDFIGLPNPEWAPIERAVKVVVTGDRPPELFQVPFQRKPMFVDGRLADVSLSTDAVYVPMPLVSDNFQAHFQWRGEGEMSELERTKLRWYVQKAHLNKQKIRFWAIPDNPAGWREMLDAGVDFVNTDKLTEFREFALKYGKSLATQP